MRQNDADSAQEMSSKFDLQHINHLQARFCINKSVAQQSMRDQLIHYRLQYSLASGLGEGEGGPRRRAGKYKTTNVVFGNQNIREHFRIFWI